MKYNIQTVIDELLDNQIITDTVAERIAQHYREKRDDSGSSRMLGIFGVLGALLVGVGLILIVAHNWDSLSRMTQSGLSFLPVIIGLASCGYALWKQSGSFTWKEGSSVFLTFAFGACVALISQIYNIPGSLQGYFLTWVVAVFPLVYIMESRVTSLLYIIGVTAYGCMAGYDGDDSILDRFGHWILLASIIPFYYSLIKNHSTSNTTYFHHWILPLSVAILLGTISTDSSWWLLPSYFILFACFYLGSSDHRFSKLSLFANGYRIIGSLGMIGIMLFWSFRDAWYEVFKDQTEVIKHFTSIYFLMTFVLFALGLYLLNQKRKLKTLKIMDWAIVLFPLIFIISIFSPVLATIMTNLFLLVMAIGTIYKGSEENHLGIVNYGLLTIAALIICRFFDTDIPFVVRGLLFIGVGAAFFFVNYKIIQNRKSFNA